MRTTPPAPRAPRRRLALAVTVAVTLGAAACGDDGASTPATTAGAGATVATTGPATTVPAASTTGPATTAASAPSGLAAAVVLAGDLPSGWKAEAPSSIDLQSLCYGDAPLPLATANSDQYSQGGRSISSNAALFANDADASRVLARAKDPAVLECLRGKLEGVVNPGGTGPLAVTAETTPIPRYGDESVALRLTVAAKSAAGTTPLTRLDALLVRVGRTGAVFQFNGAAPALDPTTPDPVVQAVLARLRTIDLSRVPTTTAPR